MFSWGPIIDGAARCAANPKRSAGFPQGQFICPEDYKKKGSRRNLFRWETDITVTSEDGVTQFSFTLTLA